MGEVAFRAGSLIEVPRLKPVAPDTWEVRTVLLNNQEETSRLTLEFPGPSKVVGIRAVVRPDAAIGGLIVPTEDDILGVVDLDNQRRFTNSTGISTTASRNTYYATLSALDTRYRDLLWELTAPRPVLGVTFRWRPTTPTLFVSASVSLAFFVITEPS